MSLVTVKTRVRETLKNDVERIAERDDLSVADVLRRFIREGVERDKENANGKESP
jgi:antitoxin component of RelBE/YafQ-DinJ toxin-antitoxin module